jgi:hypothetical protein
MGAYCHVRQSIEPHLLSIRKLRPNDRVHRAGWSECDNSLLRNSRLGFGRPSTRLFSLRGKHCFPYLQDHGSWTDDLRCVELPFFDFVCQLDSAQCYFRIPECLNPQHRITSLLGDGLMRRPTAVDCDLLRGLIIIDRFLEGAYGGRLISILTQQEIDCPCLSTAR